MAFHKFLPKEGKSVAQILQLSSAIKTTLLPRSFLMKTLSCFLEWTHWRSDTRKDPLPSVVFLIVFFAEKFPEMKKISILC